MYIIWEVFLNLDGEPIKISQFALKHPVKQHVFAVSLQWRSIFGGIHKLRWQTGEGDRPNVNNTTKAYVANLSTYGEGWGSKILKILLT